MTNAVDVVKEARTHLGYVEGKGKDNMFGKWYGMNHAAWCAMFASYCFNKAGAGKLVAASTAKGFASCGEGIKFFKKHKAWFKVEQAHVGDLAFFDWDHDGSQDHVGIVTALDLKGKRVKTIEGNTSDASHSNGGVVQEKWRNFGVIMGVGRPAWAEKPSAPAPDTKPAPTKPVPAKPAPKAPASAGKTYKVVAGDSYWRIAEQHPIKGFSTSETTRVLQKLNSNKALHPGDVIAIK